MFKTRLDSYGNDFGFVWNFGKFLIFLKIFEDSTLHGTLGKKFFEKKYPKTCSKHVCTFLGTVLGFSAILKSFWFFWKFSTTRPSKEHWAKNFFRKNRLKTCSTHVWTLLGTISGIFAIFKKFRFFWNFSTTRPSREQTLGKKTFSKKSPQNIFKTRLDTFGNDCGHFWNIESFLIFLWKFSKIRPSWNTGQKQFSKKINSKYVQNTFGHFWERF